MPWSKNVLRFCKRAPQSVYRLFIVIVLAVAVSGCSSTPSMKDLTPEEKAYMEASKKEVLALEKEIEEAARNNYDVLAVDEFLSAVDNLEYSRNLGITPSDEKEFKSTLEDARKNLADAKKKASSPRKEYRDILALRQKAIAAGAKKHKKVAFDLADADDAFRVLNETTTTEKIEPQKLKSVKDAYKKVMVGVVQAEQLNDIKDAIDAVSQSGGRDRVPCTLQTALNRVSVAERSIASHVNTPERYSKDVSRARTSAEALKAVMEKSEENKTLTPKAEVDNCVANSKKQKNIQ